MRRNRFLFPFVVVVVGFAGMLLGAFLHGRYGEGEPSKATLEAAAIAKARETARLEFERDIGVAEAELREARETMRQLENRAVVSGLSAEASGDQGGELQSGIDEVQQQRMKVAFLRSEARRLKHSSRSCGGRGTERNWWQRRKSNKNPIRYPSQSRL